MYSSRNGYICSKCNEKWKDREPQAFLQQPKVVYIAKFLDYRVHMPASKYFCSNCNKFTWGPSLQSKDYLEVPEAYKGLKDYYKRLLKDLKKPKPRGLFRKVDPYELKIYEQDLKKVNSFPEPMWQKVVKNETFYDYLIKTNKIKSCFDCGISGKIIQITEPELNPENTRLGLRHNQLLSNEEQSCDGHIIIKQTQHHNILHVSLGPASFKIVHLSENLTIDKTVYIPKNDEWRLEDFPTLTIVEQNMAREF